MPESPQVAAAKAFARSFNILIKYVRLYGFDHKQSTAQFDTAWREVRTALSGHNGLLLGVAGGKILVDGVPLEMGLAERGFSHTLSAAGISSLQFLPSANRAEFEQLARVFSTSKAANLLAELQGALSPKGGIQVNSVRFVQETGDGEAAVAQEIVARAIGKLDGAEEWLRDPQKLIQLIAAAEGKDKPGGPAHGFTAPASASENANAGGRTAGTGGVMGSAEFFAVLRVLESMSLAQSKGDSTALGDVHRTISELPRSTEDSLQRALAVMAAQVDSGQKVDASVMLKLAEHLAIRFALDAYERGDIRVNAVREMLERLSAETAKLRQILNAHEDRLEKAGIAYETHADILDRQFWAAVPEKGKQAVLLSSEAYCIPARNIRSYVEELLHRGDFSTPILILRQYLDCIQSPEEEARKRVSIGLGEIADLYGSIDVSLLTTAIDLVAKQLLCEPVQSIEPLMAASFVRLSQEATTRHDYLALNQSLCTARDIEEKRPIVGRDVRPRIAIENRLREFVEDGIRDEQIPVGLVDVLRTSPRASVEELVHQFGRSTKREQCERVVHIATALGDISVQHLLTPLLQGSANDAVATVGLLSRLNPAVLCDQLPKRVKAWSRFHQDGVIRQIAAGSSSAKTGILNELLSSLDPLIVPIAIEELAASDQPGAREKLLQLAEGEDAASEVPFLQVRAIESLGRLRDAASATALLRMFSSRGLFGWQYPREVRIACAQALLRTGSTLVRPLLGRSDISQAELELAPLEFNPAEAWVRQRRYPRITPAEALGATAMLSSGKCRLELKTLSMGGGLAVSEKRIPTSTEVTLDVPLGLKHCRSHVLVREVRGHEVSFEILDIKLEDRTRLRQLLAFQLKRDQPAARPNRVRIATS